MDPIEWRFRFIFKDGSADERRYSDAVKVAETWVDDDGDAWSPRVQTILNDLEDLLRQEPVGV